jgi:hypothetical protein
MSKLAELHRSAMDKAELALVAKLGGDEKTFLALSREALGLEIRAAEIVEDEPAHEPMRSILYRSAASIALDCSEYRTAEKLIATALAGSPPEVIAEELRELLDQVHFSRHLDVRGIRLAADEFQMSLAGNSVGPGISDSDEFVTRVKATEALIYRMAERQLHRPFREHGRRRESLQSEVELFVSIPRAASFAVSFKVGHSKQLKLPTMNFGDMLIDELLSCLELVAHEREDELRQRIPEDSYLRNFVGLANKIRPDGEAIKMVGFTSRRGRSERRVLLTAREPREDGVPHFVGGSAGAPSGAPVELRGRLKFADERKESRQRVQLVQANGTSMTVYVPEGMMEDVVTPYWGKDVIVFARPEGKRLVLEEIASSRKRKRRSSRTKSKPK